MASSEDRERLRLSQVMLLVSSRLAQSDLCALLCVNTSLQSTISSHAPLWKVLDLQGMSRAGERLVAALSLVRYQNLEEINLEFGQDVEDEHIAYITCKKLKRLNLNACQKITDDGVQAIISHCTGLSWLSLYWNLKVTDAAVKSIVTNLKKLVLLNLSGCKNVTDQGLGYIAQLSPSIRSLNLTRCVKLSDNGLSEILNSCLQLEELYLYALSWLTPKSLKLIGGLKELKLLELTGAQELTDECLKSLAKCTQLQSLNLSWCVKITDAGVQALGCPLELLSLHGIREVTDESLKYLSSQCSETLTTLDVNGCISIKKRSKPELRQLFPKLRSFQVHS